MNMNEYQAAALRTASPKDKKDEVFHLVLGLCGESGEIAEKVKKIVRDHGSDFSKLNKDDLVKELGDVLWYVAVLADHFDIAFEEVAARNIAKLADRKNRGLISGSGDNR
ncbi:MAG TPA: nucleoside triphosphate pyrophosphohydrolase family protein [Verrucomicrobiae bacterium]|nr:nucleoside triphosphate pyrophosphohydrolase family protein [Verrucomicrobiae bacterium]